MSTQEGIKYCCSLFLIFIFKMPPKPSKPIALTLDHRVEAVKKSEKNNLSATKIAEHFGVGRTQIDRILKRKAEVLADYDNNKPSDRKMLQAMRILTCWFGNGSKMPLLVE